MSQRDFSENEPEGTADLPAANRAIFLENVRLSNAACQSGDFNTAVSLYTEALALDPNNHILYSNRSAARLKQGQFALSLQDATKARELCPQWPKAYFRQGVALQCLGRYGEALATFSSGLAQDPNNKQLLGGLFEASIKSPLRHALEPTFMQLRAMKLDQSAFVVISVVGQELLQGGQYQSAVTVLEGALRIGSCSLKLRGSVFSALSSAHWALNQLDKAISYMQQDLAVAKSLGDTAGECRAHGNLGSAYFSHGSYKEALTAHRYQLVLAMKCKDTQAAAAALTSLGHVYTAIGDYPNALASHKQCVQLVKQMGDRLQEAREIGNVGAVYLAMGEFDSAVDCHTQHLRLARKLNNQVEEARAYSNLGSSHHYRRNFQQAITYHEQVLRIAQQLGDRAIESRAYAGLGHAARCAGDFTQAKRWHEKQLEMALSSRDKVGEGRALSNLGIVYQLLGEHDAALKLHQAHLTIARQMQDRAGMGRAYGNIGNAYSSAGLYEAAIKYHKQELTISKEVNDRSAEASTHGNLAVAYQALRAFDMALMHYRAHLNIAREMRDTAGEACALLNLGNCHSSRQEFPLAIPFYEQYLMLSQELGDVQAEGKACHFLGYAHYCIGNYREAVRYYDQDLALAKDQQDKMNMGRAYCNLGLAHLALNNSAGALECQKYFLAIAHMTNHGTGKFRALGNIGDVLLRIGDHEEAVKMYQRQLSLARSSRDRAMEAAACGALGLAHRLLKRFDKALGYHTQELTLRQEMADLKGECKAHGHLGAVHMALFNYTHAVKCYQEQLERAQELQDSTIEAQSFGNLGIARLNMGYYEEAIGFLEQQLATLEQVVNSLMVQTDRTRALGHLGDCYDALGDFEEAVKCHEKHLKAATAIVSPRDQERAYRGLGHSHRQMGNLQDALVCLEKRLVVSHELGSAEAKAAAYGDLGSIHRAIGNFDQAIKCLEHQRDIARELGDRVAISDATNGLGMVFHDMEDYENALRLHQMDLELSDNLNLVGMQARAYGSLGMVYERLGKFNEAVRHLEKQLSLATERLMKANACLALGRVYLSMGQTEQSVNFLRQGLAIAQSLNKSEEEAKFRHRLGLALRTSGDNENAKIQLESAGNILESVRQEMRSLESKITLFNLQTQCYEALQQILVGLGKTEEALVAAERCRARMPPQFHAAAVGNGKKTPVTNSDNIFDTVNKCKMNVLYYSVAGDELYAWFLQPQKRIERFHSCKITEETLNLPMHAMAMDVNGEQVKGEGLLEQFVHMVRDNLGVNSAGGVSNALQEGENWRSCSSENLLDEFGNERAGFLRMVNRNHIMNSSNYSLSSLFSLGSVGGSVASLQGSTRSIGSLQGSTRSRRGPMIVPWQGPSCLHALYNLLLAPFEDLLPDAQTIARFGQKELVLLLDPQLYLVPFAVLRSNREDGEYLSERCSLITVPSFRTLRNRHRMKNKNSTTTGTTEELNSALVVGAPRIPPSLIESWGWNESAASLQEATMVSDMLQAKPLCSTNATKEAVLAELATADCVHFAANLSWTLGAVVLSPGELLDSSNKRFYSNASAAEDLEASDEDNTMANNIEMPPLSDFVLTAADVLNLKLNAKLVVLSSYQSVEAISGGAVSQLANAWLAAGAGAVLISLWPVPETATKILLRAFYSALLQGARVARALAEAMQTVQHTKHFAHPANWAGFLLVGSNIRLSNKVALIGQALCELLKTPDKCRDALRVCLHLVEKSLQRIHRGQKNAMYTTQKSIDNKAGPVTGWKDLLMAVGFRFEPSANGIPSSVFFPQSDPEDRLSQCSASLQALLALSPTSIHAMSKLMSSVEIAEDIIGVMRNVVAQFPVKAPSSFEMETTVEVPLSVGLWRVAGCHELLASLGFDLMEVGQDQVTLRTGKQANRRNCQFVLQALLALFDTQEAPTTLGLESSSSTESLTDDDRSEVAGPSQRNTGSVKGSVVAANSSPTDDDMNCSASVASMSNRINPPLPSRRGVAPFLSSGSAFTSYVRRRGEPDGGGNDAHDLRSHYSNQVAIQSIMAPALECNPMNNSVDSDFSDSCYATMLTPAPVMNASRKMILSNGTFAGLRGNVKVSRPGGGTESDAAFTPSPPVTNQQQSMDSNVSLALAHQTRIRTLYAASTAGPSSEGANGGGADTLRNKSGRRPDSSSSASSATDWEGSGHATVLRRGLTGQSQQQQQPGAQPLGPPMPQPRHKLPLVDSLRPLMPVYNNMSNLTAALGDILNGALDQSTSSDSEFERGFEMMKMRTGTSNKKMTNTGGGGGRKMNAPLMDRLSVRSESTGMMTTSLMANPGGSGTSTARRMPLVTDQEEASTSTGAQQQQQQNQKLYLSANEALLECFAECAPGTSTSGLGDTMKKEAAKVLNKEPMKAHHHHHLHQQSLQLQPLSTSGQPGTTTTSHLHQKGGDSIMMRPMNREMTPTISEVYHERNLGLGLAPSLSKLLLSKNYHEEMDLKGSGGAGGSSSSSSMKSTSTMIDNVDLDVSAVTQTSNNNNSSNQTQNTNTGPLCPMCNSIESVCTCNKIMTMATMVVTTGPQVKKPTSKPWLSNVNTNLVNASDLTTADILERQKFKSTSGAISGADEITVESSCTKSVTGNESPQFSELSRRDEGDGRSVADSNCSGSFKNDKQAQAQANSSKQGQQGGAVSNAINVQK